MSPKGGKAPNSLLHNGPSSAAVPSLRLLRLFGAGSPSGELADKINESFGSLDEFKKQFSAAGASQFGSGWAWLVKKDDGNLAITKTANAETPLHMPGQVCNTCRAAR